MDFATGINEFDGGAEAYDGQSSYFIEYKAYKRLPVGLLLCEELSCIATKSSNPRFKLSRTR